MSALRDLRQQGPYGGWDAIIVGAQVAGASTALLLARAGLQVLVVDRARRGSDTLSTHALMRGGILQLRRWGLLDRVAATGAPPVRRVTFHYGAEALPVSLKPHAGVDALYAPRRTVLDALLVDAAEQAGAQLRFGVAMTDLVYDGGRAIGIVLRDRRGNTWSELARLVVGADGRDSLSWPSERPHRASQLGPTVYTYGYWPAADLDGYHWYYGDGLSAGLSRPTTDSRPCSSAARRQHSARRCDTAARPARSAGCRRDSTVGSAVLSPPHRSVPCGSSAACRRSCAVPMGRAGCWSGMPAAGGTRLRRVGITDALRDAESLTTAVAAGSRSSRARFDGGGSDARRDRPTGRLRGSR